MKNKMLSAISWFAATVNILLSIRFVLSTYIRDRRGRGRGAETGSRQHQDFWLAAGTVWLVLPTNGQTPHWAPYLTGIAVLVWLTWRTVRRACSL